LKHRRFGFGCLFGGYSFSGGFLGGHQILNSFSTQTYTNILAYSEAPKPLQVAVSINSLNLVEVLLSPKVEAIGPKGLMPHANISEIQEVAMP
jgi:hypothetical protein